MRVHFTGITPAHLEADGSDRGTAGMPRVGSWAAMVRLLRPRRRMATYIARSARLAGPLALQGSAPTVAPSRASLASRPRRRLRRALGGLGTTQAEHLERRVLLAGDSFDSGMCPEAWIVPCYEPSAEMCVPAGEWGSYSPSYHEPSASFPLNLAMFESDPGMPYSDSHSEPYLGSMEWIAYDSPQSQPVIDHVASGYPAWGSSVSPWPEFTAEPAHDVMAYSGSGSELGGPIDSVSTVEPSGGYPTVKRFIGSSWTDGDASTLTVSPVASVSDTAGTRSSAMTDHVPSSNAANTPDGNTPQVALAQAGHSDDTGPNRAQQSPSVGPVAAPPRSEAPPAPLYQHAYQDDIYILHFTRMTSSEDTTNATVTQEHVFFVMSRLTSLPRLSPAEIALMQNEWPDGHPTSNATSGRPGFEPRPEFNGAVSCIGRLQPTTAFPSHDAATLASAFEAALFLGGIVFEPLDWAMTAREIYNEPGNPWAYAGLIPLVPAGVGKLGRYGDEVAAIVGDIPAAPVTDVMRSPRFGNYVRRTEDFKHALDPGHVRLALREKLGEVSGINPRTGKPWDHLTETRNNMRGARDHILILKKYLTDPGLSPQLREAIQSELGELSTLLDKAEEILQELAR